MHKFNFLCNVGHIWWKVIVPSTFTIAKSTQRFYLRVQLALCVFWCILVFFNTLNSTCSRKLGRFPPSIAFSSKLCKIGCGSQVDFKNLGILASYVLSYVCRLPEEVILIFVRFSVSLVGCQYHFFFLW